MFATTSQKFSRRLAVVLAVCFVFVGAAFASTASWWHGQSQNQRNSAILTRGSSDNNHNVGMVCKDWVRRVVQDASQNVVTIPSTRSNDYQWNNSQNVYAYAQPFYMSWVQPGQIIQMRWRNQGDSEVYPHTAIVRSKTSSSMTWIDCNWSGDGVVRTHTVTFSQFNACVGSNFTVYEIR